MATQKRKTTARPRAKARPQRTLIEALAKLISSHAFRVQVGRDSSRALERFGLPKKKIAAFEQAAQRRVGPLTQELAREVMELAAKYRAGAVSYSGRVILVRVTAEGGGRYTLSGFGFERRMTVLAARSGGKAITAIATKRRGGLDLFDRATVGLKLAAGRYRVSVRNGAGGLSNAVALSVGKS